MNEFLRKTINDDFLWDTVLSHLPANRVSNTNFIKFNCPMCADRKQRGGIIKNSDGMGAYCFNCNFRSTYKIGSPLYRKMQDFLRELGVPDREVKILAIRAGQIAQVVTSTGNSDYVAPLFVPDFPEVSLPSKSRRMVELVSEGYSSKSFLEALEYAVGRGTQLFDRADLFWSSDKDWYNRIIFPFYFKDKLVGYTGRAVNASTKLRYNSEVPSDFLFNNKYLYDRKRQTVIVVEGVPDAVAIDGVSTLGAKMSANQIAWLKSTGKKIIVVPDRDETGDRQIDVALANNWAVSFPRLKSGGWWDADCKDCADAVKRHGRLYVVRSIIEEATENKLEINVKRKWM